MKKFWLLRSRRISVRILTKRREKTTFQKFASNDVMGNKQFWNTVTPILTSKGFLHNKDIALHIGDKTVTDCNELAKEFNQYYINIVQNTSGKATIKLQDSNNKDPVETIIKTYEHHHSIKLIKKHIQKENNEFNIKAANVGQINKIIEGLNLKKATGPNKIPVKIVKQAVSVIDSYLTNIINNDLSNNAFSDSAKLASVGAIYKKDGRNEIKNYRLVSILNCFSKIYKKFLNERLLPYVNRSISELMPSHRSGYSTNHVFNLTFENWRHALDNNLFTGAVLMGLSEAIDCIPHNLLIAKLHAYGLDFDTVTFLHNYLKHQKQSVEINNISSFFRTLLSGVPRGSILGPFLLNIFINNLFLWLTKSDFHNFADDNTITVTCKNLSDLLRTLEKESKSGVDWFRNNNNNMIANPDTFQAIIMNT